MQQDLPPTLDQNRWERRWHPLLEQWVIVAAHRQDRPWTSSHSESIVEREAAPKHDPNCHLCTGVQRVSGAINPDYSGVHVFDNDRPSLAMDAPTDLPDTGSLYRRAPALGRTRVMCYSPRHDLSMSRLSVAETEQVVDAWRKEHSMLSGLEGIESVLFFENCGEICGVSNPHPHGQIYATSFRYDVVSRHLTAANRHYEATGNVLYADILDAEQHHGGRLIAEREHAVAFVPWFARYAYEVHVAPRRTVPHITALNDDEAADLAAVLNEVLVRYDNLWKTNLPYLMTLQQAPVDGATYSQFHFHIQLYPPLRKPGLLKYVAAHETGGGNFLADTVPDESAAALRAVQASHWTEKT